MKLEGAKIWRCLEVENFRDLEYDTTISKHVLKISTSQSLKISFVSTSLLSQNPFHPNEKQLV
jgi:hypothetical protein